MIITDEMLTFHFEDDVKNLFREIQNRILNGEKLSYHEFRLYILIIKYFDNIEKSLKDIPKMVDAIMKDRSIALLCNYKQIEKGIL